ncbi:oligopeptide/dipeptide ABC transporter ATP-binding protein [Celerinatantimonas sp. YJH-8]|uniref:oligopeptide/dipeptide ABC transporter ATP-binding protein n=1 Tax=Celerinatantimonas sp. YJH-8 TaxID=3228714 RepID=UPI0038C7B6B4
MKPSPLMILNDVRVQFAAGYNWLGKPKSWVHALNGLDLEIKQGETLGIVGESGCGKSTLAKLLIGLLKPSSGEFWYKGREKNWLGKNMQIVFQDPQSSLDPRLVIWKSITEPVYIQQNMSAAERFALAENLAEQVGIRKEYLHRLPHEFSGGQRQRISIARALSSNPDVIVLDEPTSALDISVQGQILNLLMELKRQRNLTYILISHNMSVIRHMSDRVAVMYLGQIVELADSEALFEHALHPYTRLLLDSLPQIGKALAPNEEGAKKVEMPSNQQLPERCFFFDRCPKRSAMCARPPQLAEVALNHQLRCVLGEH